MTHIKVILSKIVDHEFPIFAQFEFTDFHGETIVIQEKLPIIGMDLPHTDTGLPLATKMECIVVRNNKDRMLIDISVPNGIADIHGRTRFNVGADLVAE